MRQCCGPARGFIMHIANNFNQVRWLQSVARIYTVREVTYYYAPTSSRRGHAPDLQWEGAL